MTRFSEDGERGVDERVAVLEFELRKAKETIIALRAQLTVATGDWIYKNFFFFKVYLLNFLMVNSKIEFTSIFIL